MRHSLSLYQENVLMFLEKEVPGERWSGRCSGGHEELGEGRAGKTDGEEHQRLCEG
jgi:hypothetical protein